MNKQQFNSALLTWFYENKRELPWRETSDPYKIWLSEVMLQQTQVKTVIPYYNHFISKYPTLDDIANADQTNLLKDWEGLGYYNRIRNFNEATQEVQANYNSIVPDSPHVFQTLKGVGPYIQGAVMSIAFNHKIAAVDGNVMRVYSRIEMYGEDISKQKTVKFIKQDIETWMDDAAGDFNEAMMELGATICTPKAPKCIICPVKNFCDSFETGVVMDYPVKAKARAKREKSYNVFIVQNKEGALYLMQQDAELLKGMYEFPKFDVDTSLENVEDTLGVTLDSELTFLGEVKHVFTHKTWLLEVYLVYSNSQHDAFKSLSELSDLPMSKGMQKVFALIDG